MCFRDLVRAAENKYNRLLSIMIVLYLLSPFLLSWSLGNLVFFFVFLSAIIGVVYQIAPSKWTLIVYIGLVGLVLVMRRLTSSSLTLLDLTFFFEVFGAVIFVMLLALSIYMISLELTSTELVTLDIVKGGICVYFLLGFLWAALYGVTYSFDPNSFNTTSSSITKADLTHFSFTT